MDKGVIQPLNSPWESPIVLVCKKDGSTLFSSRVDYPRNSMLSPRRMHTHVWLDDTLATLAGSHWFSAIDLTSGYWQVRDVQRGPTQDPILHHWRVIGKIVPIGLCNAKLYLSASHGKTFFRPQTGQFWFLDKISDANYRFQNTGTWNITVVPPWPTKVCPPEIPNVTHSTASIATTLCQPTNTIGITSEANWRWWPCCCPLSSIPNTSTMTTRQINPIHYTLSVSGMDSPFVREMWNKNRVQEK